MLFGQPFGLQSFANPIPTSVIGLVGWKEICPTPSDITILSADVIPWDVLERPTVDIIPENDPDLPDVDQLWLEQRRSISGRSIERC